MEIVFQDEYFVLINKPSNLLVHHSHYARNLEEASLVELMEAQGMKVYPVHRLDRKTSGLLICAKEKEYVSSFQKLIENNALEKKYLALVRGFVAPEGVIDSPVKNDRGNYKEAETHFRCLKQLELSIPVEPYQTSRYSVVEFSPKTGRMHQLRIHANKISHPIIGDPKHGNRHHNHMFIEKFGIDKLFLHASSLKFTHPYTEEDLFFEVEVPEFWDRVVVLDKYDTSLKLGHLPRSLLEEERL